MLNFSIQNQSHVCEIQIMENPIFNFTIRKRLTHIEMRQPWYAPSRDTLEGLRVPRHLPGADVLAKRSPFGPLELQKLRTKRISHALAQHRVLIQRP